MCGVLKRPLVGHGQWCREHQCSDGGWPRDSIMGQVVLAIIPARIKAAWSGVRAVGLRSGGVSGRGWGCGGAAWGGGGRAPAQGVLEAVRVCSKGYPTRRVFSEFIDRFALLVPRQQQHK